MHVSRDPDDMADLKVFGDDAPVTDPAAKARARARLEHAIQSEGVRPRSRVAWRPFAAAAAAALVTVASWSLLQSSIDPSTTPKPPLQETPLLQLAMAASSQPAPTIPVGSFVYTRSRVRATSSDVSATGDELGSEVITSRRETWIAEDGSGLMIDNRIGPVAAEAETTRGGPGTFPVPDFDELPTAPAALLDAIMGPGYLDDPDGGFEVLSGIGALLRDPFVSPAHREALFLIVEDMEDVEVEENYRDPVGRFGIAVSLSDGSRSVILVFESGTSDLLMEGEERDGGIFEALYLETAIVSARGERPGEPGA